MQERLARKLELGVLVLASSSYPKYGLWTGYNF